MRNGSRIIVTWVGLLLMGSVAAQWEVQTFAGAGLSRMRTDLRPAVSRGEFQEVGHRTGWILGIAASHPLSGPLSFATGLNWSSYTGHEEHWIRGYKAYEGDRRVHYIGLPMMVRAGWCGVYFGLDTQVSVYMAGEGTFTTYR